jgi:cytochrome c peroxidase
MRERTPLLTVILFVALSCMLGSSVALTQQASLTPIQKLGKELFFDNISQPARSLSCAPCHGPSTGWTGDIAGANQHGSVYRGAVPTRFGNRKPPAASYAPFSPVFHFDAQLGSSWAELLGWPRDR